jgi:hypothetical protein
MLLNVTKAYHDGPCPSTCNCSLPSYPNRMPKAHPADHHMMSKARSMSLPKRSASSPSMDSTIPLISLHHFSSTPSPSSSSPTLLLTQSITIIPPHSPHHNHSSPLSSSLPSPPSTTANTLSSSKNPKISHPSTSLFALAKFHPDNASTAL